MSILDFAGSNGKNRKQVLAKAQRASDLLKALSHKGRLLMLCLLADGEKSVSEIEALMGMPQAAVSQQLSRLRLDGLVSARRDGRNIHYSIASKDVARLITTLHALLKSETSGAPRRRNSN